MTRQRLDPGRSGVGTNDRWRAGPDRPIVYTCKSVHTGPHNRCAHPTAHPKGYRRCAADPSCPILISTHLPHRLCSWHADDIHAADLQPYADLIDATAA